jgi:hypothetical protein
VSVYVYIYITVFTKNCLRGVSKPHPHTGAARDDRRLLAQCPQWWEPPGPGAGQGRAVSGRVPKRRRFHWLPDQNGRPVKARSYGPAAFWGMG